MVISVEILHHPTKRFYPKKEAICITVHHLCYIAGQDLLYVVVVLCNLSYTIKINFFFKTIVLTILGVKLKKPIQNSLCAFEPIRISLSLNHRCKIRLVCNAQIVNCDVNVVVDLYVVVYM